MYRRFRKKLNMETNLIGNYNKYLALTEEYNKMEFRL